MEQILWCPDCGSKTLTLPEPDTALYRRRQQRLVERIESEQTEVRVCSECGIIVHLIRDSAETTTHEVSSC